MFIASKLYVNPQHLRSLLIPYYSNKFSNFLLAANLTKGKIRLFEAIGITKTKRQTINRGRSPIYFREAFV